MDNSKLRPIDVFPIENGLYCFKDPLGFSDKMIVLGPEALFVCTLLDGTHSLAAIKERFIQTYGVSLSIEKIKEILMQLDTCLFLENDRFFKVKAKMISDFKAQKVRYAFHSGTAYESDPVTLKKHLDFLFLQNKVHEFPDSSVPSGRLCGLIAPHIDLHRGGACFVQSYRELARESKADTFIILGIAHTAAEKAYVLTDKDFQTPLGTVSINKGIMDTLRKTCKHNFFTDEYIHKIEHSVEFQVLFLQYLYPEREISIVPVLCSMIQASHMKEVSPYNNNQVMEFIDTLKRIVAEYGEKVCVIAGVDLSHIGRRFGQDISITPKIIKDLEKSDQIYLDVILRGDAEGFIKRIHSEDDKTNICGIPAIYTLLKIIELKGSRHLKYDQAIDNENHSIVSFAGAGFYR